jgi:hypothetical protein
MIDATFAARCHAGLREACAHAPLTGYESTRVYDRSAVMCVSTAGR